MLSAVDTANSINYATGATYGPDSALTAFVSGSGGPATITNSFSYNKRLQPLTMSASTSSQTVFSIGYDFHAGNGMAGTGTDNGNVYGITNYKDSTRSQSFTYDALNRVLTAQNSGTNCATMTVNSKTKYWGNSYAYDAWGNLLGKTITKCGAENLSLTADAHNWIHASGTDYQYDAAGNMTFDATASLSYNFDQENRITGAAGYTYTYDGDGNRVRKSNGNTASSGTLYWYMAPGVVAESDLAGTLKSEYVFFDGERVARKDFPGNTVAYYFSDHLKTASVITNASGTITAESDYYPWGGELQFVNNDSNDYKFTGKKRDTETGLDYFGARYYSNGLGRWISADWSATPVPVPYADFADPQTLNLYQFVGGNPASKADADGHCDWCHDAWDFGTGIVQGIVSSASMGAVGAPKATDSTASLLGQMLGTAFEGANGTITRTAGVGAIGTGLAGEGPSAGTSTALVVGGAVAIGAGAYQEAGAAKNAGAILNAMAAHNPYGSNGKPDHQAGVDAVQEKAKSEAKPGESVPPTNTQVQGVNSRRKPDAQIVNANGKTRKVFEAERHPNRKRNKEREEEYKKLKLPNETHPLK
jgi:RHS repeat-associated protein